MKIEAWTIGAVAWLVAIVLIFVAAAFSYHERGAARQARYERLMLECEKEMSEWRCAAQLKGFEP